MAQKFLTNIDLNQNQLINSRFQSLPNDPSTDLFVGWTIFNTTEKTLKYYDGTQWRKALVSVTVAGDASAALTATVNADGTVTLTPVLATTSAHGVMSSTDKAKLDAATAEATVSTLVIRDASGNIKVAIPTDTAHAATKGYVDSARQGLDVKASVRVATTGNITLSGTQTIDAVAVVAGDRVLVKNQTTGSENGIYVVAAGAWSRSEDAATSAMVTAGMFTFVEEGASNADSGWVLATNQAITLDTTSLAFVQFSGAGQITAGAGLTKAGNTVDVGGTADRITVNADSVDIASTYVGQATITTLGTITTGVWNGTTVTVPNGGTGVTSATTNGVLFGNNTSALQVTAAGTEHQVLRAGSGGTPSFGAVDLAQTAATTGQLLISRGGTNASTEATARTNLGVTTTVGAVTTSTSTLARIAAQGSAAHVAGTSTTTVTHNFNTRDVIVQVYENGGSYETVVGDVARTDANSITVTLNGSHAANAFRIVVTAV